MKLLLLALFLPFLVEAQPQSAAQGLKSNNAAAPAADNLGTLPCVATAGAPVYIEGRQVACSTDLSGNLRTAAGAAAAPVASATWDNTTALNSAVTITVTGLAGVAFSLRNVSGAFTTGMIVFEASDDASNFYRIDALRVTRSPTGDTLSSSLVQQAVTLNGGENGLWQTNVAGFQTFRIRLQIAITGTGVVAVRVQGMAAARDPYTPTAIQESGIVASVLSVAAAANQDYLTVFNGTGSGQILKITKIWVSTAPTASVTAGLWAILQVRHVTTAGTTCTAANTRALATTGLAIPVQITFNSVCTTNPTAAGEYSGCAVDADDTPRGGMGSGLCYVFLNNGTPPITLTENNGVMVQANALNPVGPISVYIEFSMSPRL